MEILKEYDTLIYSLRMRIYIHNLHRLSGRQLPTFNRKVIGSNLDAGRASISFLYEKLVYSELCAH